MLHDIFYLRGFFNFQLTVVLNSPKAYSGLDKDVCIILVANGLDVTRNPTRNSGSTRRFVRTVVRPSAIFECMAGITLANITFCAVYIVLLADNVQKNQDRKMIFACRDV